MRFDGRVCLHFDDEPGECMEDSPDTPDEFRFDDRLYFSNGGSWLNLFGHDEDKDMFLSRLTRHRTLEAQVTEEGEVFEPPILHTFGFDLGRTAVVIDSLDLCNPERIERISRGAR